MLKKHLSFFSKPNLTWYLFAIFSISSLSNAAPVGGEVTSGTAQISQSGNTTNITQETANVSLSWQSFNIGSSETVNFLQPSASSIAINRIFDTNGTQILGHLNANGQVYLINPNGILFGQGSQVNVGGLVASTLDLSDDSLSSNIRSFSGSGTGSIINQGTLTASPGGYIALLGNQVINQGYISAQLGTVALGAGSATSLTFDGNSLLSLQVDQSTLDNLAANNQLIQADGGQVIMTAGASDSLLASVVNNTGVIQAQTVEDKSGTIRLVAGMTAGTTNMDGTLDVSAPNGGNGGFIETSAAQVNIADTAAITTFAPSGVDGVFLTSFLVQVGPIVDPIIIVDPIFFLDSIEFWMADLTILRNMESPIGHTNDAFMTLSSAPNNNQIDGILSLRNLVAGDTVTGALSSKTFRVDTLGSLSNLAKINNVNLTFAKSSSDDDNINTYK